MDLDDTKDTKGVRARVIISALTDPYRSEQVSHSGKSACKDIVSMILRCRYDGDDENVELKSITKEDVKSLD